MYRLAAPETLPELLREIVEVGKVAIVAEAGVLWLIDRPSGDLVMVIPPADEPERITLGSGHAGQCADSLEVTNIHECREDDCFQAAPVNVGGFETRSLLNVPILTFIYKYQIPVQFWQIHPCIFNILITCNF